MNKLKLGLFGVGHLGKIHLNCIQQTGLFEVTGIFDPDDEMAEKVCKEHKIKRYLDKEALISVVDVVDIVTPTLSHYEIAKRCIFHKKHFFVEKPLTYSLAEAEELIDLMQGAHIKAQVGHVERFNPAFLSLPTEPLNPMFIEAHRLSNFNPRGTDVSVVLDLMIHDLDIILTIVDSPILNINAVGVSVLSNTDDICNARIEFENGCIANVTASRISMKQMRKLRLFHNDSYISLDFLAKKSQVIKIFNSEEEATQNSEEFLKFDSPNGNKFMSIAQKETEPINAIKLELESLYYSIIEDKKERVSLKEGYNALKLAHEILAKISQRNERFANSSQIINS